MNAISKNNTTKPWLMDLLIIALFCVVYLFLFLGGYPLRLPDEGRYAEVAREMLNQHNYITPTLNGVVFFDKPPLYYWLSALAMHIGGVNESMARAASALFGLLGILGAYVTGYVLDDRRTGLMAAGILGTMPLYFLAAHFANCDLIVAVSISLSLWSTLIAIVRPEINIRRLAMLSAYFWCALAILAKGLIGLVFPVAAIGLFILVFNRWSLIKSLYLVPGLLLIALLILPWFIAVSRANPDFLNYFFYVQQYLRFISHSFNDPEPFWFYIPVILLGLWPWPFYLIQTFKQSLRKPLQQSNNTINGFLIIWALVIFIFFSIPTSKTIGYIVPVFPPLALLLARYVAALKPENMLKFPGIISLFMLLLIGLALLIVPHFIPLYFSSIVTTCLGLGLLVLSAIGFYLYRRAYPIYLLIIGTNVVLLLVAIMFGNLGASTSAKPLAIWLNTHHISADKVYAYERYPFDLPFYLQSPIKIVTQNWQDPALSSKDSWDGEFAYGLQQTPKASRYFINQADFVATWSSQQPIYVLVATKHVPTFQADVGTTQLTQLVHSKQWTLVTNVAPN